MPVSAKKSSQKSSKQIVKREKLDFSPEEKAARAEQIARNTAHRAKLDAETVAKRSKGAAPSLPAADKMPWDLVEGADGVPVAVPYKRSKRAKKTGELKLDTLDVKPPISELDEKAKKLRFQCLQTGKSLLARGNIRKELYKAGKKICNCRVIGLFQEVAPTVHYKIGAALCKQRFCPNCQRVLSAKRKQNTLDWFELNRSVLRKYFFYHMVLTVPHSMAEGLRTGLYVSELLDSFAKLRGTAKGMSGWERKENGEWWSSWIAGGFYYVENKPGKDGSPHIHLHAVVLAKKLAWNAKQSSKFMIECGARWAAITQNTKAFQGVFIDPVYYIDQETKQRVNCHLGSSVNLQAAVSEAAKYTMKTDTETLSAFSDDFLADMLTAKNRYYGRFGCLNAKHPESTQFQKLEMLRTDFKDLEQVSEIELRRLFNPETGEIVDKVDTRLVVTQFRNMRATETAGWVEGTMKPTRERVAGEKVVVGEMVYALDKQVGYTAYYPEWDRGRAIARMGAGMSNDYDPNTDLEGVAEYVVKKHKKS